MVKFGELNLGENDVNLHQWEQGQFGQCLAAQQILETL